MGGKGPSSGRLVDDCLCCCTMSGSGLLSGCYVLLAVIIVCTLYEYQETLTHTVPIDDRNILYA